ncbi:hypothetical protein GCM10028778_21130 [Barrientosiimonas marina]|uniref:Transposase n=1 Tax=Lentibacillus kimchii TaxID=1542911 RepID=A0ABW2UWW7_9BACI
MSESQKKQRYSKQTKLEAIRRVLENNEAVQSVVDDLNIRHRDNIYEWIKKYQRNGEAAFDRSLGRPKKGETSSTTEEKVDRLQIEVDALKKYLELSRQKEEKQNFK